jgi:hypothetical protein
VALAAERRRRCRRESSGAARERRGCVSDAASRPLNRPNLPGRRRSRRTLRSTWGRTMPRNAGKSVRREATPGHTRRSSEDGSPPRRRPSVRAAGPFVRRRAPRLAQPPAPLRPQEAASDRRQHRTRTPPRKESGDARFGGRRQPSRLARWGSARISATQAVTRTPLERWRNSFGPHTSCTKVRSRSEASARAGIGGVTRSPPQRARTARAAAEEASAGRDSARELSRRFGRGRRRAGRGGRSSGPGR